ncbi:MAG: threonine synthase [Chitinophagaceae bacterium]|nr:threonine synthase [Chitinophagaceae bacterium]
MKYFSTNRKSPEVNFKDATLSGQAPDKGLYFPITIPVLPASFLDKLAHLSNEEIAFKVIQPYVGDCIPDKDLMNIVNKTIAFDFPLKQINENIFALELFHGPTLAFKDVGAGFMSCCLGHFAKTIEKEITVLVATSGDTGGAVAAGFAGIEGVRVIILYPSGKVSNVQELQLTTWGGNIQAYEVDGNFDDCQSMVKQAFADYELQNKMFLTSANSINVARWLPQQFYYFFAWKQWADKNRPPIISVPSGNFGNICSGLLAMKSGLPFKHFIAACNTNKVIPEFMQTGNYQPQKAKATLSNAMDVGDPSNFVRILEIFDQQFKGIQKAMSSYSISDDETIHTIKKVKNDYAYLLDPHGAVGYAALEKYLSAHSQEKGIFLETAHPVKFDNTMEKILGYPLPLPAHVKSLYQKVKGSIRIDADYHALKNELNK